MSVIQEAVKKSEFTRVEEPASSTQQSVSWNWLPNLLMFVLLAVALWNYLSEREYRRQMEARLETAISELEGARADVRRIERQNRETEDLLHAELEASNGRITKMRFDLESMRQERDLSDAALASSNNRIEMLESQNKRLHEVIQSLRSQRKNSPATTGSVAWDLPSPSN